MMNNPRQLPNVQNDYRVFMWFLTLTTVGIYVWFIATTPSFLNDPIKVAICTLLIGIYLTLHWFTVKIYYYPQLVWGYLMLQGALAFFICLLADRELMIFALYLAMIGETIGMFGLSRRGLVACVYYLALSLASFAIMNGPGSLIWWLIGTVPTVLFVGIYVTLYNRQTEANDRARELLAELETANQQLSAYAAQVEDLTIAAERQRMARELHDTLSQGLAGLILQLEAADAHLAQNHPEKARQIVQQTMNQARVTLGEARSAIDDLRRAGAPALEAAVHQELKRFRDSAGTACTLEINLPAEVAEWVPQRLIEAITRIISEALTNIQKHAQASQVSVRLDGDAASGINLEICDNGIGFNPNAIPSGHYGLIGIRERTRLAGGTLEIESQPGAGTRLIISFPPVEEKAL